MWGQPRGMLDPLDLNSIVPGIGGPLAPAFVPPQPAQAPPPVAAAVNATGRNRFGTRDIIGILADAVLAGTGRPAVYAPLTLHRREQEREEATRAAQVEREERRRLEDRQWEIERPFRTETNEGDVVEIDPRTNTRRVLFDDQPRPQAPTNTERTYQFILSTRGTDAANRYLDAVSNPVTWLPVENEDGSVTRVPVPRGASPSGTPASTPTGGAARGTRNNNAGNLEDGPFARSQPGYRGSDGRFAIFDTPEQGNRAQETLLRSRYLQRPRSVSQIIRGTGRGDGYAPPQSLGGDNSEESVSNYIGYVARRLGVDPGQPIDISRGAELARAMREFETGQTQTASAAPAPQGVRTRPAQPTPGYVRVQTIEEARRLPRGTRFIAPDGTRRVRP